MSDGTFVYDDECGFCTWLADYFGERTDLELASFDELTEEQLAMLPDDYEDCSHLVTPGGDVHSCGAAIEQALALADVPPGANDIFEFLRGFRDYERFREEAYGVLADQRSLLGQFLSRDRVGER